MTRLTRPLLAATLLIAAISSTALQASAGGPPPGASANHPKAAPLDQYGGDTDLTLTASGYFHTQLVNGRWWLVTPDGHPFFSAGVNHVTSVGTVDRNGHAAYADTVTAKYGSDDAWATAQVPRLQGWGFNTLGGWSDNGLFDGKKMPYTVMFGFGGLNFVTGEMSDFWDPGWEASVNSEVAATAGARRNDPWLVGYWLSNELHWNKDFRFLDQLDLYLQRPASSAGKQHLVAWLRSRYADDFASFAADFAPSATTWTGLADPTTISDTGPGAARTRADWAGELAERFFSFTDAALKAADPNHLNLGSRFLTQVTDPEVAAAAGRHVDVVSVNWYDIKPEWETTLAGLGPTFVPTSNTLKAWNDLTRKPLIISEFGYRAMDSGLPNTWPPFQKVVDTQQQRADGFRNYVDCAINTGYVVGTHWFEMTDEPAIGRADGEDDNWGLVSEADNEYALVTQTAATLNDHAYAAASSPSRLPFPCTPVGPQIAPPASTTTTTSAPATTSTTTAPTLAVNAAPSFTG